MAPRSVQKTRLIAEGGSVQGITCWHTEMQKARLPRAICRSVWLVVGTRALCTFRIGSQCLTVNGVYWQIPSVASFATAIPGRRSRVASVLAVTPCGSSLARDRDDTGSDQVSGSRCGHRRRRGYGRLDLGKAEIGRAHV